MAETVQELEAASRRLQSLLSKKRASTDDMAFEVKACTAREGLENRSWKKKCQQLEEVTGSIQSLQVKKRLFDLRTDDYLQQQRDAESELSDITRKLKDLQAAYVPLCFQDRDLREKWGELLSLCNDQQKRSTSQAKFTELDSTTEDKVKEWAVERAKDESAEEQPKDG